MITRIEFFLSSLMNNITLQQLNNVIIIIECLFKPKKLSSYTTLTTIKITIYT